MTDETVDRLRGPFGNLAAPVRSRLLKLSGAGTVVLFIALAIIDGQISADGGPGIIALEVAGSPARASEILGQWGDGGIDWARISLLVDFPFLVAYGTFLALACTLIGPRLRVRAESGGAAAGIARHLAPLAPGIGWAFIAAALLDMVENIALLRVIAFDLTPWALMAQAMAAPKFAILGAGIPFLIAAAAVTAGKARSKTAR